MKLIDKQLLDDVSRQAQKSDRLRMNYNFHQSLDDKCHRFLNAVEPGTKVEIHRHPTKDESFVLLRGRVRVNSYNDDGTANAMGTGQWHLRYFSDNNNMSHLLMGKGTK